MGSVQFIALTSYNQLYHPYSSLKDIAVYHPPSHECQKVATWLTKAKVDIFFFSVKIAGVGVAVAWKRTQWER